MLGAGKMANLHLETLKAMPGVRLVGVCSRTQASGDQISSKFGIERAYVDPTRMLGETSPDAVFVAVSHTATFAIASLVLETGVPCLLEKPAGYSLEETTHLCGLAGQHHCLNLVGLNRRFYSVINQALLAVLQHGEVQGVLVEAHEPILEYRSRRQFEGWQYDHWLTANSIHAIDLLRMVGGDVAEVAGFGMRVGEPLGDNFSTAIKFVDGPLGTFVAHWNSGGGFGMKIYGRGVVAELSPLEQGFLRYETGRRVKLTPDWADKTFRPGLYAQNASFLQSIYDGEPASFPGADLKDNVKTMRLVEQIQDLAAGGFDDEVANCLTARNRIEMCDMLQ